MLWALLGVVLVVTVGQGRWWVLVVSDLSTPHGPQVGLGSTATEADSLRPPQVGLHLPPKVTTGARPAPGLAEPPVPPREFRVGQCLRRRRVYRNTSWRNVLTDHRSRVSLALFAAEADVDTKPPSTVKMPH
jgi:hypothetical protein